MTVGGWATMGISVGFVTLLFGWCLYRVFFGKKSSGQLHGIEDIDKGED